MHQHPRPSPRSATPATNLATNPERTNNSRDPPPSRSRSSVDLASYTERASGESAAMASRNEGTTSGSQDRESSKLNQIIQNFHTKAALMICSARASLPQVQNKNGEIRQNRWFNTIIDETDVLVDDLQEWRRPDLYEHRPRPLVIEVYLDTAHLAHNQSLVIVDDAGRRTEVSEALATSTDFSPRPTKHGGKFCEVVLERWTVELGGPDGYTPAELNDLLPNVYKKGVVLFRAIYAFLRFLPTWKLHRRLGRQAGNHNALRLKFRIRKGQGLAQRQRDTLYTQLCPTDRDGDDVVDQFAFDPLVTPVGPLSCTVEYRTNCGFGIADQESLLSSRFLGLDDVIPTLPAGGSLPGQRSEQRQRERYSSTVAPTTTTRERPRGLLGAYGSLGTFHGSDKRGSPVSELKQRALDSDHNDDMKRVAAIRTEEGAAARTPVNFVEQPPFKGGSLASSPRPSPSPSTSAGRTESILAKYGGGAASTGSKRASLNTLPQQQLRAPSIPNETAIASSGSSSPKPAPPVRYSSSFANRTRRFTSQSSKAGESNASSGRGSSDSKERSDQLNEAGDSGSTKTDEDDIASFISDLEKSKDIKFHTPPSARDNVVNLAKYAQLRDPSTQLAEDMNSSSLIQQSSTPPSRRLSNVPGLSTSSSPSRALAQHAPHVRSRLSTHSIVEEATGASGVSGASGASGEGSDSPKILEEEEEDDEPFIFPHDNNID